MALLEISRVEVKKLFFDQSRLKKGTATAAERGLSRFGAAVFRQARQSIRRVSKNGPPSKPGNPPFSRTDALKKNIFFYLDKSTGSVVIGPIRLDGKSEAQKPLEFGGETTIVSTNKGKRTERKVTIAARPYMGPAFEKILPRVPQMFRGAFQ